MEWEKIFMKNLRSQAIWNGKFEKLLNSRKE